MNVSLYVSIIVLQSLICLSQEQSGDGQLDNTDSCSPFTSDYNPCSIHFTNNSTYYQPPNVTTNHDEYIRIIQLITKSFEINTNCTTGIVSLLCHYLYPPCTDGVPRPLCVGTCRQITQRYCQKEWSQLRDIAIESNLLKPLVHDMNCQHNYYTNNSYTNISQCWNVTTSVQIATNSLDMTQLTIILSLIFAFEVLLLLVTIGVTIIVVRKLHKRKTLIKKEDLEGMLPAGHNQFLTLSVNGATQVGTLRSYMMNSFFGQNKKIQSQRMLLENVPLPYSGIMSEYTDYLLQEDKLQLIKFLADGQFTEVYQGNYSEWQSHGTSITHFVAIKRFKEPINTETVFKYIKQCLQLTGVDHPNVLKLKGLSFGLQYKVLIVSPYYSQHNLLTYLRMFRMQKIPKVQNSIEHLVDIIRQIASGMKALTEIGFTYKMLSSETCLIDSEGNVVIGDLSYSWYLNQTYTIWNAPEIQSGNAQHSEKSDVWSFGVTALEILNMGGLPASSEANNIEECLLRPLICPQSLYNVLERCFDKDPNRRPIFALILRQINELLNNETFLSELSQITLNEDITQPLYGPNGYLRILHDNNIPSNTEQEYLYTSPLVGSCTTSPPVISVIFNDDDTEDGYVECSPQPTPSPKLERSFTPRSSPVPQFCERSDSEDDDECQLHDYYNVHFRPVNNK